jgi:hypothetical protein
LPWRKRFFFEKKNQKTFARFGSSLPGTGSAQDSKVFCFFFSKKKTLPSLPDAASPGVKIPLPGAASAHRAGP